MYSPKLFVQCAQAMWLLYELYEDQDLVISCLVSAVNEYMWNLTRERWVSVQWLWASTSLCDPNWVAVADAVCSMAGAYSHTCALECRWHKVGCHVEILSLSVHAQSLSDNLFPTIFCRQGNLHCSWGRIQWPSQTSCGERWKPPW